MIYLDNASTTHYKPKCVLKATKHALNKLSVNAGRGGYALSIKAGQMVLDTRINTAKLFGAPSPQSVVFTASCTHAINMAIRGTIRKGGHIVATCFEHNSVLRTLDSIKTEYGIDYTLVLPNKNGTIGISEIENAIRSNTYMVITIHASNVTGITQDISAIGNFCNKHNLIYMVDAAQSAGHIKIDMTYMHINLLTLAGHKGIYAPQGIGALLINNVSVKPIITGGTGTKSSSITQPTDLPEGLESGTLALPNILGFGAGINYISANFDKIASKINKMTQKLIKDLSNVPNIKLYSKYNEVGVVSFNIIGMPSTDVANKLFEMSKICVRSGLQCAPMIHKINGTLNSGMVRISLSAFNNNRDIDVLIKTLYQIVSNKD